jgi:septal ring factor EnvC (AmiA/AmiB activator)
MEGDAGMAPLMPSRERMAAAATTTARLLEQKDARLEELEAELEEARARVREIAMARAELRKDLKVLGRALEVIMAAARATPSGKVGRRSRNQVEAN